MDIRIQGQPRDGKVLMNVYIDDHDNANNAKFELLVTYDDSMTILRENARSEVSIFLKRALDALENLDPQ